MSEQTRAIYELACANTHAHTHTYVHISVLIYLYVGINTAFSVDAARNQNLAQPTNRQGTQALGLLEPTLTALAKAKAAVGKILQVVDRKVNARCRYLALSKGTGISRSQEHTNMCTLQRTRRRGVYVHNYDFSANRCRLTCSPMRERASIPSRATSSSRTCTLRTLAVEISRFVKVTTLQ